MKKLPTKKNSVKKKKSSATALKSILKPSPTPLTAPTNIPSTRTPSNILWENIVLHYLNKLKNKLSCTKSVSIVEDKKKKSTDKTSEYEPSESQCSSGATDIRQMSKKKALSIVKNAVEYGQSKGIVAKDGKYFWFRHDSDESDVKRSYGMCSNCRVCRRIMSMNQLMTDKSGNTSEDVSNVDNASMISEMRPKDYKDYSICKTKHPKSFDMNLRGNHYPYHCRSRKCRGCEHNKY
ncbi:hypothetical protein Trydic_g23615 [Trypoxylus dichotomus]